MNGKSVLIVDDHTLFRNGLKLLINSTSDFHVMGEAADGRGFLEMIDKQLPDVVLLDISMPEMDGIEAAQIALSRYPHLPIITLSMYGEEDYYFKMVSLGVKGFVLKNSDIQEVVDAMESVSGGGTYFSQELLVNLVSNLRSTVSSAIVSGGEILSQRELEILVLICKGLSNQEIGDELFISKRTVDKHRANILAKTNCKNTANLVVFAIKNHLVEI
ncbi:MAG: response regulator transcription factor [Rikenellaceae bacterium]|nr:response regulator transcription factor [Rikenellaceae bacterium]